MTFRRLVFLNFFIRNHSPIREEVSFFNFLKKTLYRALKNTPIDLKLENPLLGVRGCSFFETASEFPTETPWMRSRRGGFIHNNGNITVMEFEMQIPRSVL